MINRILEILTLHELFRVLWRRIPEESLESFHKAAEGTEMNETSRQYEIRVGMQKRERGTS